MVLGAQLSFVPVVRMLKLLDIRRVLDVRYKMVDKVAKAGFISRMVERGSI